jgi:uncharacterized protein DUF4388
MNRAADSNPQLLQSDSAARPEPPARDGSFSGRLKALSICDVLEFLRVLNRRGILVLREEGREVSVQVQDGRIVGVVSNHPDGNLAEFLFREQKISREQVEAAVERERNGERPARILIEAGVLTPKSLWEALRRQAQSIINDLFEWEKGEFSFHEVRDIAGGGMDLGLPILGVVGEGIRSVRNARLFSERMPSEQSVFEATPAPETRASLPLEPHERYVLSLIDGERSLGEVVKLSEIGRSETLRVIFLLFSTSYLKMRAYQAPAARDRDGESLPLIRRYNEMFAFLHGYLVREVGPIGEAILSRYLMEQKKQQPALLAEQSLGRDGSLDERQLHKSARGLGNGNRPEVLLDGLNELLYSELLAIRRTLGPQHEGRAIQGLRELGLQPVLHADEPDRKAR